MVDFPIRGFRCLEQLVGVGERHERRAPPLYSGLGKPT